VASWLVLDWDHDQFHLLTAQSARRGVQVSKAATWAHPEPFTPSTAERVGKALRDFLKASGIVPAPVIVGIGRDRVFLKELRFPPIAAHEEAALVRFQTAKELAEPADNYAVDYVQLGTVGADREIMTVATRREVLTSIQTLCLAAGLKLHAVTPRLFGVAHALARAVHPQPNPLGPNKLNVVLSVGQRWAELCFFKGDRLVQAQALANGSLLVSEVKRNLAVFQAQHAVNIDWTGPDALYVFSGDAHVLQALEAGQQLPVQPLNPLYEELEVAAKVKSPAAFAGAVGLAALWSQSGARPVNLAAPKKALPPVSISRQRGMMYGSIAAAVLLVIVGAMYWKLSSKQAEIKELVLAKTEFLKKKQDNAQLRAEVDAYKEWEQTTVPWLDELYDLSARFPFEPDFRINRLQASLGGGAAAAGKAKGKDGGVIGSMNLTLVRPANPKADYVTQLLNSMVGTKDPHITARRKGGQGTPNPNLPQLIDLVADIKYQPRQDYTTHLVVPPQRIMQAPPPQAVAAADKTKDENPDADGDEP
jgi:hypothetical protein